MVLGKNEIMRSYIVYLIVDFVHKKWRLLQKICTSRCVNNKVGRLTEKYSQLVMYAEWMDA